MVIVPFGTFSQILASVVLSDKLVVMSSYLTLYYDIYSRGGVLTHG